MSPIHAFAGEKMVLVCEEHARLTAIGGALISMGAVAARSRSLHRQNWPPRWWLFSPPPHPGPCPASNRGDFCHQNSIAPPSSRKHHHHPMFLLRGQFHRTPPPPTSTSAAAASEGGPWV